MKICSGKLEISDDLDRDGDAEFTLLDTYQCDDRSIYLTKGDAVEIVAYLTDLFDISN